MAALQPRRVYTDDVCCVMGLLSFLFLFSFSDRKDTPEGRQVAIALSNMRNV